ncbi:hypothetical protein RBI14_17240 [Alcaligenaceae bacterium B3P038]|nr:hypothetical protein [Alcaligenaceae bacterium B3P038]
MKKPFNPIFSFLLLAVVPTLSATAASREQVNAEHTEAKASGFVQTSTLDYPPATAQGITGTETRSEVKENLTLANEIGANGFGELDYPPTQALTQQKTRRQVVEELIEAKQTNWKPFSGMGYPQTGR